MRILHVTYIFPPELNVADGITQVVYRVTRALTKKGCDVTVYASNAIDLNGKEKVTINKSPTYIDGVKIKYFPSLLRYNNFFFTPTMFYSIRNDVQEFDVIHIHSARSLQCAIAAHYAKIFDIPVVFQPHGSFKSFSTSGKFRMLSRFLVDKIYAENVFRTASKIMALSHTEAELYRSMGVPKEKIVIIPNGIDLSEYTNLPSKGYFKKKFGIKEDKKIILYLGRIHESKGIDLLLKAYANLINDMEFKDSVLVVAGPDDGFLASARVLASSLGINDFVIFTGFISSEDKLKAFVDAEVFVTPSFYGFPITFLEACATGTPIVTTTLGDNLMWIDGKAGYVISPVPTKIADAMYRLLIDEDIRKKFSENCREIVRSEYSLEKIVDRLEYLYKELIGSGVT